MENIMTSWDFLCGLHGKQRVVQATWGIAVEVTLKKCGIHSGFHKATMIGDGKEIAATKTVMKRGWSMALGLAY